MENKYYIPQIEEYCVGFRFERLIKNNYQEFRVETPYKLSDALIAIQTNNIINEIRVKYLDKSDIKECGWIHNGGKCLDGAMQTYIKGNEDNPYVLYYAENNPGKLSINIGYGMDLQIFRGTIKNITELKKLMEQLGIK